MNYIKSVYFSLLLFLFLSVLASESMIKLIRQDTCKDYFIVYCNDTFIDTVYAEGNITWNQQNGEINIQIKGHKNIPEILTTIEQNKMYEIFVKDDRYSIKKYAVKSSPKKTPQKEKWKLYLTITGILAFGICYFLIKNRFKNKHFYKAKQLIKEKRYREAITILQKLVHRYPKKFEYWNLLERGYITIHEIDKADVCREHIKSLLSHKIESSKTKSGFRSLKEITRKLNQKGFSIAKMNIVKKLEKGLSGYEKYIVEIIPQDKNTTLFGVLKQQKSKQFYKQNDLLREAVGYENLKQNWIEEIKNHIPRKVTLLSKKDASGNETNVLFSYFAEEEKTDHVISLLEGLSNNFNQTLPILNQIRNLYLNQYNSLSNNEKSSKSLFFHTKETLFDKWKDILAFNWEDFNLPTEKPYMHIHRELVPNCCYFLKYEKMWSQKSLSFYHYWQHGDLNPENIMLTSSNEFVLIDFEKVSKKPFFYDLAFLTGWFIQSFVLEKHNVSLNELINDQPIIINQLLHFEEALPLSSHLVNFHSILYHIYPNINNLDENEKIDLQVSLFTTFVLRSYYEFRDCKKFPKESKQHRRNGLFFYSLASRFMQQSKFLKTQKVKISDAFDYPLDLK